jgi:hypothetical protein
MLFTKFPRKYPDTHLNQLDFVAAQDLQQGVVQGHCRVL